MGWAVGYDTFWQRDVGYGVPAICDHPDCGARIDRGLSYVCGSEPFGGDRGCGLYFCADHLHFDIDSVQVCVACLRGDEPFTPKGDVEEWKQLQHDEDAWAAAFLAEIAEGWE